MQLNHKQLPMKNLPINQNMMKNVLVTVFFVREFIMDIVSTKTIEDLDVTYEDYRKLTRLSLHVLALNLKGIIGDGGAWVVKDSQNLCNGHSLSVQISNRWVVLDKSNCFIG